MTAIVNKCVDRDFLVGLEEEEVPKNPNQRSIRRLVCVTPDVTLYLQQAPGFLRTNS